MSDIETLQKGWIFNEEWGFGGAAPEERDCECWGRALLVCANGDGHLSPEERNWVLGYSATNGVAPEHIEALRTYKADEDLAKVIHESPVVEAKETHRALVYDVIRACAADGELSTGERDNVYKMAELLGVDREIVDQLEDAYHAEMAAKQARFKIAFPEGSPF